MDVDTSAPATLTDRDLDLTAAIRDVLNQLDLVRGSRARVSVQVSAGQVTLTGAVQSPMVAVDVERAVADVPGVEQVRNDLVDDGNLRRAVAEALAADPRTQAIPPGYQVTSVFAQVTLIGRFTDAQAQAVMAVTQAVPGVAGVNVKTY
ncbi:MAG: BON domain-containing protein [Anaerolineales bacterium]|nr:BON domain-containing protein [Anaerolineales bacterium]